MLRPHSMSLMMPPTQPPKVAITIELSGFSPLTMQDWAVTTDKLLRAIDSAYQKVLLAVRVWRERGRSSETSRTSLPSLSRTSKMMRACSEEQSDELEKGGRDSEIVG